MAETAAIDRPTVAKPVFRRRSRKPATVSAMTRLRRSSCCGGGRQLSRRARATSIIGLKPARNAAASAWSNVGPPPTPELRCLLAHSNAHVCPSPHTDLAGQARTLEEGRRQSAIDTGRLMRAMSGNGY
jgi:hypothetical protein